MAATIPPQSGSLDSAKESAYPRTYRIRGIPSDYSYDQTRELLTSLPRLANSTIDLYSLAAEAGKESQTATATFKPVPAELISEDRSEWDFSISPQHQWTRSDDGPRGSAPQCVNIVIDKHFQGLTTLKSISNSSSHDLDCIAITGLNGHAFGSFKQRSGNYMWLRDTLPTDLPGARIMTYGFDSHMHKSESFQDLESLATALRNSLDLNLIKRSSKSNQPTPLVFIAFSLGGLILKQALIQMGKGGKNQTLFKSVYGILFFGVPNQGLNVTSLLPMVKGQPNEQFIHMLGKSQLLRDQCRDFRDTFDFRDSEIVCFYETTLSPSAIYNKKTGNWEMKGPPMIFVDNDSAIHGRSWEDKPHHIQGLDKPHRELVKFSRQDPHYDLVLNSLLNFESKASEVIQKRFGSLANDDQKPHEYSSVEKECIRSFDYQGMYTRQHTISRPVPNTCQWYQNTPKFRNWIDRVHFEDHNGLLWIKGNPGSGKSVLMKNILTYFQDHLGNHIILSFFFNARGSSEDRQFISLLRSLIHQLIQQNQAILSKISVDYQRKKDTLKPGWSWEEQELQNYISRAIETTAVESIFILIDALDECDEAEVREVVLFIESLMHIASSKICNTKLFICLASRHYPEISISKCYELVVQNHNDQDIAKYVQSTLKLKTEKEIELSNEIIKKASGIFLWTVLVCKDLTKRKDRGETIKKLRVVLRDIPDQLEDLFGQCFSTIDSSDRKISARLLQCVLFARRPIRLKEIQYMLNFSLDSTYKSQESFQNSNEYIEDEKQLQLRIQHLSAGLIERVEEKRNDHGELSSTGENDSELILQFIHESVREFLSKQNSLHSLDSTLTENIIGESHDQLCKACINYLNIDELRSLTYKYHILEKLRRDRKIMKVTSRFPFLEYATKMCFIHAAASERAGIDQSHLNMHFHMRGSLGELPWTYLADILEPSYGVRQGPDTRLLQGPDTRLLHVASEHGLLSSIRALSESGELLNLKGGKFSFSLLAASIGGHEAVVKLLLDKGADIHAKEDNNGWTALVGAAWNGHEAIVKLLLDKGADVNVKDNSGWTALHRTAWNGHETIVKLLLDKGADVNAKDSDGWTALIWAAENGYEATVKLLLEFSSKS
ncbi:MAG: hypothetical protein M1814_003418 [Vezdaea aestivalis]|nr:MAG: hypothetical protein M1814_003418 [Vezdaea aestivalis]